MKIGFKKVIPLLLALLIGLQPTSSYSAEFNYEPVIRIINAIAVTATFAAVVAYVGAWVQKRAMAVSVTNQPVSVQERLKDYIGTVPSAVLDLIDQLKDFTKYKAMNVPLVSGIIFHGDPGCGKTHLARVIAGEIDCPFFEVNATSFSQPYIGHASQAIVKLFSNARKAAYRHVSKVAIIFIDEFDAIGSRESKSSGGFDDSKIEKINTLLSEMDGFDTTSNVHVIVIAATNYIDKIDSAVTRPGRFDKKVYISYANQKDRKKMIDAFLKKMPSESNVSSEALSQLTQGMSAAGIKILFNSAGTIAIKDKKDRRDKESFVKAFFALKTSTREQTCASQAERKNLIEGFKREFSFNDFSAEGLVSCTQGMTYNEVIDIVNEVVKYAKSKNQDISLDMIVGASLMMEDRIKKADLLGKMEICKTMYEVSDKKCDSWLCQKNVLNLTDSNIINEFKQLVTS